MPGDTGRYGRDMDEEVLACHGAKARYARTQYVQCVGPWGQAALRLRYGRYAQGWYAWPVRTLRRPRGARVSLGAHEQRQRGRGAGEEE